MTKKPRPTGTTMKAKYKELREITWDTWTMIFANEVECPECGTRSVDLGVGLRCDAETDEGTCGFAPFPTRSNRDDLLDRLRALTDELTPPQEKALDWYAKGGGYGALGGRVVLRSCQRKGLARPTKAWGVAPLCVTLEPLGRAVLHMIDVGNGRLPFYRPRQIKA